ncbi:putative alpha/beta hydrolase [Daldinia caldariorum]|uniref:putative alpha/beta hydrolase n=1 Tax=Daldinia caldariorum TaxID=326644 RepID=UPI002008102C|nr:putative alpha/beta hydrolase [Daldinia caldariorum]KAI1464950.1 putative alpha/beta hydrolase [Daldinia caldariorum]
MAAKQTVQVAHLAAQVGYAISNDKLDLSKPTWVLINSLCTSVEFYRPLFESKTLANVVNLVAIEPLGHGATTCATEHFNYWDTALAALQALEALGVKKAYALGTSQGGWIVVKMALLAPEKILGLIPLGTSMDAETSETREKGCWDPVSFLQPILESWRNPNPDFIVGDEWIQAVMGQGFGSAATPQLLEFWSGALRRIYSGNDGRQRLRMAVICLASRDSLLLRIDDIKCPVHWLHGSADTVYTTAVAEEHSKLFTGSSDVQFDIIEGGSHFLSATNPKEVEEAILAMTSKA